MSNNKIYNNIIIGILFQNMNWLQGSVFHVYYFKVIPFLMAEDFPPAACQ